MRRKRQALSEAESLTTLQEATAGVLAVDGDEGYPYAVPLSYAYEDGKLYFHSAKTGHKLDAIARNDKASFCVIAEDHIIQETFTTHFRSAIAFGRVRVLTDPAERRHGLMCLAQKYSPDFIAQADSEIAGALERTAVLEMDIEEVTGKAAIEIIKQRGGAAD